MDIIANFRLLKEHCGLCEDFSCKLLHQFAYDEKEGIMESALSNEKMG